MTTDSPYKTTAGYLGAKAVCQELAPGVTVEHDDAPHFDRLPDTTDYAPIGALWVAPGGELLMLVGAEVVTGLPAWLHLGKCVPCVPAHQHSPPGVDVHGLSPGLYRFHWRSGGSSLVAVGMTADGKRWVAPTNWVHPADPWDEGSDFSSVLRVEEVEA